MKGVLPFSALVCLLFLMGCNHDISRKDASGTLMLSRVLEVDGRQGIAADGKNYYVSGSTALYKYSPDGRLLLSNTTPFETLDMPANHLGDIAAAGGEIYAGCETFIDGRGQDLQLVVYDTSGLAFKRSIPLDLSSGQVEISGVAVDMEHGILWSTDWVDGRYLYRYDLHSGKSLGKLHLQPVPQYQQGLYYRDGMILISADDGDAEENEADHLYAVKVEPGASAAQVSLVKTFSEFKRVGEIEGISEDPRSGEFLVLANRGSRIILGMPRGFYPGYTREIHEVYVFRQSNE